VPVWCAQHRLEWIPQYRGSSILAGLSVSRAKSGLDPISRPYHGQIWNAAAELARAMAVNESTVRRYLDLLTGVFMVRQLPPWFENLGKRQVKAPKVYLRDSGLLHALLGIANQHDLEHHPKVGASWEGYAVEEVLKTLRPDEAYYWATYNGAKKALHAGQGRRGRAAGGIGECEMRVICCDENC